MKRNAHLVYSQHVMMIHLPLYRDVMDNDEALLASVLNENVIGHILRKILKVSLNNTF